MADAIAIDFGTSRTKLAYWAADSKPELMRFEHDRPFIPSLFYLPPNSDQIFYGHHAEQMQEKDPKGIIDVLKRQLRNETIRRNGRPVSPGQLLTFLFAELSERTGRHVKDFGGVPPKRLFLTLPALHGPTDEQCLKQAAVRAGFEEDKIELVEEPVAAARAWLAATGVSSQEVIVLDCGGGTIDWAYLRREGNDFRVIPECPPGGDKEVGGHDVDMELLSRVEDLLGDYADAVAENKPYYLQQVRILKEHYCLGLPLAPLKIAQMRVELKESDIQGVFEKRFIEQTIESLRRYLEKVSTFNKGTQPTVLLVGGSSRIKGLREAGVSRCGFQVVDWERSEYATVLGALPPLADAPPIPGLKARAKKQYRGAVEMAWADKKLGGAEVDRLITLAAELKLTGEEAAEIEGSIMGDFKEAILDREAPKEN